MLYIEIRIGMLCTDGIASEEKYSLWILVLQTNIKDQLERLCLKEEVFLKIKIEKPELLQSVIKRKTRYLGHIGESGGKDLKKMTMIVNEKKGKGKRRTNWTSIVFENLKIKDMRTAGLKANDKETWKQMEDGT